MIGEKRLRAYEESKYVEVDVVEDERLIVARVGFGTGCERYLAVALHELVATGKLDARIVQHWLELCKKGDGPKVDR